MIRERCEDKTSGEKLTEGEKKSPYFDQTRRSYPDETGKGMGRGENGGQRNESVKNFEHRRIMSDF